MHITKSAISLNVQDERASAVFLRDHFGFEEVMGGDGFVSLTRDDAGIHVIYLRTGLATFTPSRAAGPVDGLLVVFEVDDIDKAHEQLIAEGVPIETDIQTEPWGERFCQVADPNGVIIQLVQWVDGPPA